MGAANGAGANLTEVAAIYMSVPAAGEVKVGAPVVHMLTAAPQFAGISRSPACKSLPGQGVRRAGHPGNPRQPQTDTPPVIR